MRMFGVPFDINEEDKLIGGYLSLRQAGWLAIPLTVLVVEFVADMSYITHVNALAMIIKILVLFVTIVIAGFMAFGSMDSMNADQYVFKMIKFKYRKKVIMYNDKV
ncbi:MAG TPA: hypothetical protein DEP72_01170 [Clostridiales bacterium]|nr:MAG: hypothetical protein A2Y18_01795 [Clostridiales bacterium GWD2_32_19]HCC06764.1 hypothetical protein [Clostridiales bacterium]